jgi:hypothetical protein
MDDVRVELPETVQGLKHDIAVPERRAALQKLFEDD